MFLYFAAPKNLPPGAKDPPSPPLAAALVAHHTLKNKFGIKIIFFHLLK
jgi:hypothetical protein